MELQHSLSPIDELIPYARNARVHTDEHVAQLAASIREFGFNTPVLVDKNKTIIAGHGRVLAARKLGLAEVPVVTIEHLTETQKKAFILADNKLHDNSGFDYAMLQVELDELKDGGFDLSLSGFEDFELTELAGDNGSVFDDLATGVFSGHLAEESESFSLTFTLSKEEEPHFEAYFQENTKEQLTARLIEIVKNG